MIVQVLSIEQLADLIAKRGAQQRSITAIAGPPGVGKSTAAAALETILNARDPRSAAILPMDGYHLDDTVLVPRGQRGRKGSPDTFDVGGFASMLDRLKADVESEIAVPVFDRDIEIARAGARMISQSVRHIIVEGNYLLLNQAPWRSLFPIFDTTVLITADLGVLRQRLVARWKGLGLTETEISAKVDENDLVNAALVLEHGVDPEFVLEGRRSGQCSPSLLVAL